MISSQNNKLLFDPETPSSEKSGFAREYLILIFNFFSTKVRPSGVIKTAKTHGDKHPIREKHKNFDGTTG
jgi:hypothetical protein